MKKTNLISLIVFVVALVWVFTLKNDTIRKIQANVLGFFGIVHSTAASVTFTDDIVNHEAIDAATVAERYEEEELAERYSQLLKELFDLRASENQIEILREENVELKRSLNFVAMREAQQLSLVAARVTNRQSGSWWKTVTIDRGSADGVVINSTVETPVAVDDTGNVEVALVGKVTVVGKHQSTVVLATDEECHVAANVKGAYIESSSTGLHPVQGILSGAPGAGTSVPHLILGNLDKDADRFGVEAGARVYSAGIKTPLSEGIFPPGLLLGFVKEFVVKDIDAEARVTPAIDFNTLSHVFVLLPGRASDSGQGAVPVANPATDRGTPAALPVTPVAPRPMAIPVVPEAAPEEKQEPEIPRASRVSEDVD